MIFCSCQGLHGWVPVAESSTPCSAASRNSRTRASRCDASASARLAPRPERISISDEISSPATEAASTSSCSEAARSSSKRCVSERVSGSRIPNSSSSPTGKSSEASKASLTPSRFTVWGLGQVEVERVEQVYSRAGSVDRNVGRHLQQRLGVVEDDLDARLYQGV